MVFSWKTTMNLRAWWTERELRGQETPGSNPPSWLCGFHGRLDHSEPHAPGLHYQGASRLAGLGAALGDAGCSANVSPPHPTLGSPADHLVRGLRTDGSGQRAGSMTRPVLGWPSAAAAQATSLGTT